MTPCTKDPLNPQDGRQNEPQGRPQGLHHKKGLIFDLDGTLINTLADIATAINLTRQQFGLPLLPAEEITSQVGNGEAFLLRQTVPIAAQPAVRENYHRFYAAHMLDQSSLHPGVAETLNHFKDKCLGVVTNKPIAQTKALLAGLAVQPYFCTVLGGDSLAEMKPHPLPLLHFMQENQLKPEETTMIGDGVNDIRAGKAAGVLTVGVSFGVSTPAQLRAEQPDFIIDRMATLQELID